MLQVYAGPGCDTLPNSFGSVSRSKRNCSNTPGKKMRGERVPEPVLRSQPLHSETKDELSPTALKTQIKSQSWTELKHAGVRNWKSEQHKASKARRETTAPCPHADPGSLTAAAAQRAQALQFVAMHYWTVQTQS